MVLFSLNFNPQSNLNFQGFDYTAVETALKFAKWWIWNELLLYHGCKNTFLITDKAYWILIVSQCEQFSANGKTMILPFPKTSNEMEFRSCICIGYRRGFLKPNISALSIIIKQLEVCFYIMIIWLTLTKFSEWKKVEMTQERVLPRWVLGILAIFGRWTLGGKKI